MYIPIIYVQIKISNPNPGSLVSGRQSRRGAREARQLHGAPGLHREPGPGRDHRGSDVTSENGGIHPGKNEPPPVMFVGLDSPQ